MGNGKWTAKGTGKYLGSHATEAAAVQAYDNYVKDGVDPVTHRGPTSSQFKGVTWKKSEGKWRAQCMGKCLGHHATEEAAARAYNNYVEDGIAPVKHREGTFSQFKGVSWDTRRGKWLARCKGKCIGYHATEEAAAQACANVNNGVFVHVTHRGPSSSEFKGQLAQGPGGMEG